jgi:hypothetical protein
MVQYAIISFECYAYARAACCVLLLGQHNEPHIISAGELINVSRAQGTAVV